MYRLTKAQRKKMERVEAWLTGQPFRENSRDKNPQVPQLSTEQVLADWVPSWDPSESGQFFTPLEMGRDLLSQLWVEDGARVLEPCAGIGNLVYQLVDRDCEVDAYEVSVECVRLGEKLFPKANWEEADPFDHLAQIEGQYDYVVANPPFNVKWATAQAEAVCTSGANRSQHYFLELITRALKPSGQAAIIGPYNLVDKMPKAMREWFDERMVLEDCVGPLPGEFALTKIRVYAFYFTRLEEPVPVPLPTAPASDALSLVIDRELLLEGLTTVSAAANRNGYLPVLSNVLLTADLGQPQLQTNNLETAMTTWVQAEEVGQAGSVSVPAHFLAELVKLLPGPYVTLATGDIEGDMFGAGEALNVTSANHRSRVKTIAVEDCPIMERPAGESFTVPADQLAGMFKQVAHYVGKDDCGLPALTGILFQLRAGKLTVVASNRVCLALSIDDLSLPDMEVVLPINVLTILSRHLSEAAAVEVILSDSHVMFKLPNLEIIGKLTGQPYPDYTKVIPQKAGTQVYVSGEALLKTVKLARNFSDYRHQAITFDIGDKDAIQVTSQDVVAGDYRSQLEAVIKGDPIALMFAGDQLTKGLAALDGEEVVIEITNKVAPVIFWAGRTKQVIQPLNPTAV